MSDSISKATINLSKSSQNLSFINKPIERTSTSHTLSQNEDSSQHDKLLGKRVRLSENREDSSNPVKNKEHSEEEDSQEPVEKREKR